MFARPIQVAIAVVIAIGSVSTAAYASDAALVPAPQDQGISVTSDVNEAPAGSMRLLASLAPVPQESIATGDLRAGIVGESLKTNVISKLDVVLAQTSLGAQFVATKLNSLTYSWSNSQMGCLNTLWSRESHWNFKARNSRSGAYGIPQANPGTKMASAGKDWRTNPITQIKWGMSYINSRYGNPCAALASSSRKGWY